MKKSSVIISGSILGAQQENKGPRGKRPQAQHHFFSQLNFYHHWKFPDVWLQEFKRCGRELGALLQWTDLGSITDCKQYPLAVKDRCCTGNWWIASGPHDACRIAQCFSPWKNSQWWICRHGIPMMTLPQIASQALTPSLLLWLSCSLCCCSELMLFLLVSGHVVVCGSSTISSP